ncbi:NAD(+) synthase [Vampirovibrio chlorellavorus]|uniref:NAD(+) synthase n=1 Tax=Vampirovibrio chlorellavorus TaxID=758823 RepID=UPI0026EC7D63|nr:NAD(+) synthase [Vampirovibrio chlorellavorus]
MTQNSQSLPLCIPSGFVPGYGQGNLALAQINPSPGDLAGNARKIIAALRLAEQQQVDLVIFPELALMGYPPRDVIVRHPFLVAENLKWLRGIAEATGKTYALVGFVEPLLPKPSEQRIGKAAFNAAALLGEGKIQAIFRKSLIPGYNEFEDYRQFESSPVSGAIAPEWLTDVTLHPPLQDGHGLITVHGHRYAVSICEDLWNDPEFFEHPHYPHNPIAGLLAQRPEVLINLSSSPSRAHKESVRHQLCGFVAKKHGTPLVYVNQVGTVDELSFDGGSRAYDGHGQLLARAESFQEQLLILNPFKGQGHIAPLPGQPSEASPAAPAFQANDTSDLARTYQSLLQGIRDYFAKTGFQKAVLGLSGGLDSAVVAVLVADALGPENLLTVSMPSAITPDENRSDTQTIAKNLGCPWIEIPIGTITEAFTQELSTIRASVEGIWGAVDARSNAADNVQAISRATLLRQLGNEFRALPVATSDKSEFYMGYATVNGDMSGALAPIGDVCKTKVRALARWLNEHRPETVKTPKNVLPLSVITKPSGADLKRDPTTGELITAEAELMPYEFADEVIWRLETLNQSHAQLLNTPFYYEQQNPLPPAQKAEWLDKFFDRMSKAVFKWFVAPPILIVEGGGSIAKSDYHHPIVANRIHWQGHSPREIRTFLSENTEK